MHLEREIFLMIFFFYFLKLLHAYGKFVFLEIFNIYSFSLI